MQKHTIPYDMKNVRDPIPYRVGAQPAAGGVHREPDAPGGESRGHDAAAMTRERASKRRKRKGAVTLYFANVTSWNSGVVEYLQSEEGMGRADVVLLVETHLKGAALAQAAKRVNKIGYKATMVGAVANPDATRAGPGHGGVSVLTSKTLHARPLRPTEKCAVQLQEHEGMPTQWTATTIRLAAVDIVVAVIYLAPNVGIQGSNWSTLMELADYLHVQGLPFIIAGGYNCEIWELEPTGIAEFLGAEWLTPRGPAPVRRQREGAGHHGRNHCRGAAARAESSGRRGDHGSLTRVILNPSAAGMRGSRRLDSRRGAGSMTIFLAWKQWNNYPLGDTKPPFYNYPSWPADPRRTRKA